MKQKGKIRYPDLVSIRLEPELREELEKWSDEEDRPLGSLVRVILREAIEVRKAKGSRKVEVEKPPPKPPRKRA